MLKPRLFLGAARGFLELGQVLTELDQLGANRRIDLDRGAAGRATNRAFHRVLQVRPRRLAFRLSPVPGPGRCCCGTRAWRGCGSGCRFRVAVLWSDQRVQVAVHLRVARTPVALSGNELVEVRDQLRNLSACLAGQLVAAGSCVNWLSDSRAAIRWRRAASTSISGLRGRRLCGRGWRLRLRLRRSLPAAGLFTRRRCGRLR